jgi:segregation and condensation protein B
MEQDQLKRILEAAILASSQPITLDKLLSMFDGDDEQPDRQQVKEAIDALTEDCEHRGIELRKVASGYRYQARQDTGQWLSRLREEKPPRYSRALLETLALIAYRQPITRAEIEEVRGVSVSSNIIKTLLEREWIRIVGHREVPGKPAMFGTTKTFLDYFNLTTLNDLPPLSELVDLDAAAQQLDLDITETDGGETGIEFDDSELTEEEIAAAELDDDFDDDEDEGVRRKA